MHEGILRLITKPEANEEKNAYFNDAAAYCSTRIFKRVFDATDRQASVIQEFFLLALVSVAPPG